MAVLTENEKKLLILRYGLEDGRARKQEEVAKELGINIERVKLIEARALRKLRLRHNIEHDDLMPDTSIVDIIRNALISYDIEIALISAVRTVLVNANTNRDMIEMALGTNNDEIAFVSAALNQMVSLDFKEVDKSGFANYDEKIGDFVLESDGIEYEIRYAMENATKTVLCTYYPKNKESIGSAIEYYGDYFQSLARKIKEHVGRDPNVIY